MPDRAAYRPMRDLDNKTDRIMILLAHGQERYGRWDADRQVWRSAVDPRVTLYPVAWREMPVPNARPDPRD